MVFALCAPALAVLAGEASFSLRSIDATLSKVAAHAQNFPPKFSSSAERAEVEAALREAITILDAAVEQYPDNPDLLRRDGFANAMGHNLDFEGCADRCSKSFERLLVLRPADKQANFYYGGFLASTATGLKDSIPYLKKAVALGVSDAHYTLGFVYTAQGDKTNALLHLREYSKLHPEDDAVKRRIAKLERPSFRVVREEGPPPGFDEMTKKKEPTSPPETGATNRLSEGSDSKPRGPRD